MSDYVHEAMCRGGVYRGIYFEVRNWKRIESRMEGIWNYYIYIPDTKITDDYRDYFERAEEYNDTDVSTTFKPVYIYRYTELDEILQLHNGITYMKIEYHPEKYYVVGCDYNHLSDEGNEYDFDNLLSDVRDTIDDMYEKGIIRPK